MLAVVGGTSAVVEGTSGTRDSTLASVDRSTDGESVAGWGVTGSRGDAALLTEFDAAGNDVLDMSFSSGVASYRVVKAPLAMFDAQQRRHTAGSGGWTDTGPSASGLRSLEVLSRL